MEQAPSILDVIVSLVIGGAFGWFTGGVYNKLNGRTWSGKGK